MTDAITGDTVRQLRAAVKDCSERGLIVAAKWATDLLLAIPPMKKEELLKVTDPATGGGASTSSTQLHNPTTATSVSPLLLTISTPGTQSQSQPLAGEQQPRPTAVQTGERQLVGHHPLAPKASQLTPDEKEAQLEFEMSDHDSLIGAKAFFDAREFRRAAYMLQPCRSNKALFLGTYCFFMANEKQALNDWHKLDANRNQTASPVNESLNPLLDRVNSTKDPWCLFLKALFLSRLGRREDAIEAVLMSIAGYPWNWSAWTLLNSCINDAEELAALLPLVPLPATHPLVQMFLIKISNELQSPSETELAMCDRLLSQDFFPCSMWVMGQRADVLFHLHDYAMAEAQFDKILQLDPYRVDELEIYSNILYVQDNKLKLSQIAQDFIALDKDRPEVCCLVGNHYSLRQEHEKAVRYFRRATQLDGNYLTAWILLGHEYVEMKSSHAGIEAYRRAVDINRKDYRTWYGLGQAYDLLGMHHYSLYYYQHATALRPYDVRLWQAQGSCYEEIGRPREAIDCYKRALISSETQESTLCLKLARLHKVVEEYSDAVSYHKRVVELCQNNERPITEYAKSSLEVAEYHMNIQNGDLLLARQYLEQVAASNAEDVARATELLKTVKAQIKERGLESQPTTPAQTTVDISMAE